MEFVVKTKSGSKYHFFEYEGELRVNYNSRKEMQVSEISIVNNCLVLKGFDFNMYGIKNSEECYIHSTPIKSVNFVV